MPSAEMMNEPRNILFLYSAKSVHTSTVYEHLESFKRFSIHNIVFDDAVTPAVCAYELSDFDAVFLHYSVRLSLTNYFSESFAEKLAAFSGVKVLFIQDEYDDTEQARKWMERLQFTVIYTCVPEKFRENVYSSSRFPNTEFVTNLTGYVPERLLALQTKPIVERQTLVGYRGRALHPVYGALGFEKKQIGIEFREHALRRQLAVDIQWDDAHRIYGPDWYQFLANCRATLGSESGSNIFDFDGSLRKKIDRFMIDEPLATFDLIKSTIFPYEENAIAEMAQISPKIFEAIALKTALVLFEGSYSNVIQPDRHYISLKKDFSNITEVFEKLSSADGLQDMVDRAYEEIVRSTTYHYSTFVKSVDRIIDPHFQRRQMRSTLIAISYLKIPIQGEVQIVGFPCSQLPKNNVLSFEQLTAICQIEDDYIDANFFRLMSSVLARAFKRKIKMAGRLLYGIYGYVPLSAKQFLRPLGIVMRRLFFVDEDKYKSFK